MAQSFQVSTPPAQAQAFDMQAEQDEIARRRRMADILRQQSAQPEGQMVSGRFVAPSITQRLAGLFNAYQGGQMDREATQQARDLAGRVDERRRTETTGIVDALRGNTNYTQAGMTGGLDSDEYRRIGTFANPDEALRLATSASSPEARAFVPTILGMQQQDKITAEQRQAREAQMAADQAFRREQAEAQRQAQMQALAQRAEDQRLMQTERFEAQRQLAAMQAQARQDAMRLAASMRPAPQPQAPIAVLGDDGQPVLMRPDQAVGRRPASAAGGPAKPLPAAIQKMVQENIEIIGTAGSINADLAGITQQIEKGTLRFNPASNLVARARNATGLGNEQTANFASFRSNMERLRNESLRLNKGVQTDGDAQRAWNELFDNINDQGVVSQRLAEIQKINERAMALRGMDVERIYGEFGRQAPDLSRYGNLPGATNLPKSGSPNLPQIVPPQRPAANSAQPGGAPRVVDFSSLPQ